MPPPTVKRAVVFFALLLTGLLIPANARYSANPPDINFNKTDWEQWARLLHYREPANWSESESLADNPDFFLSIVGSTSPEAELSATLAAFTNRLGETAARKNQHAICQFPARYAWLDIKTFPNWKKNRGLKPEEICPDFGRFFQKYRGERLALSFASYHLDSASSIFGHTQLIINQGYKQNGQPRKKTISYIGRVPEETNILRYFYDGLAGGFRGVFQLADFGITSREYLIIDRRDIWEYETDLSRDEIEQLVRHLHELKRTHFDYYFLDENCSFRLLKLLEVARPRSNFTKNFWWLVKPADTVRAVAFPEKGENILRAVRYHPSLDSVYRMKYHLMTDGEKRWTRKLASPDQKIELPAGASLRPALVYSAAADLLRLRQGTPTDIQLKEDSGKRKAEDHIRSLRAAVDQAKLSAIPHYNRFPLNSNPLLSHFSANIFAGAGWGTSDGAKYTVLGFSPAGREFVDGVPGYSPFGEMQFVSGKILIPVNGKPDNHPPIILDSLYFVKMTALKPVEAGFRDMSWGLESGLMSDHHRIPPDPDGAGRTWFFLNWSGGFSLDFARRPGFYGSPLFPGRLTPFLMGTAELQTHPDYHYWNRLGLGYKLGLLWRASDHINLEVVYRGFPLFLNDRGAARERFSVKLALNLNKSLALLSTLEVQTEAAGWTSLAGGGLYQDLFARWYF